MKPLKSNDEKKNFLYFSLLLFSVFLFFYSNAMARVFLFITETFIPKTMDCLEKKIHLNRCVGNA